MKVKGIVNLVLAMLWLSATVLIGGTNSTTLSYALTSIPSPAPTVSEEVSWKMGDTLVAATITRPDDEAIHPAVVFVAGSGPTDRDWVSPLLYGKNGSARLLAEEFAKAGYVTIRYDKRIAGPNAQNNLPLMMGKISMEGHVDELAGAVDALIARPDVNPDKIFVLANSEGALHALNYQRTREPKFAGLILSAMPGRGMTDLLHGQLEAQVASLPNARDIMAGYDKLMADYLAGKPFVADPKIPKGFNDLVKGFHAPVNLPFAREFLSLDPAQLLKTVTAPILVIIGKKDIQVDPLLDGIPLETAAKGLDNIRFVYPENADHVLKYELNPREELTGAAAAKTYNAPDRILDPGTLQVIKNWLEKNG
ncbi:MAG: alpha/beta fold hydrolase [Acidobacteriota bacterium]|nr:alpha/beta fold hydrolase [Acidobacteriota bacterium]